jgi:hypothetical protein
VIAANPKVGLSGVAEHFPCGNAGSVVVVGADCADEHDASNIAPIKKIKIRFRINPLLVHLVRAAVTHSPHWRLPKLWYHLNYGLQQHRGATYA